MTTRILLALTCGIALAACHDDLESGSTADVVRDTAPPPARCAPDQCDILGRCWDNGDANPSNTCEACVILVDRARFTADDSASCDDGNACTSADHCRDGHCDATPLVCDDADPCTVDLCQHGACVFEDAPEKCGEDPCKPTATRPAPDCDDDDPCTADRCQPHVGCVNEPLTDSADAPAKCDDASVCTLGDHCEDGACVGDAPLDCDDHDLCTIDICRPTGGCDHPSIASLCADANPCTDERCDPAQGCIYPFNTVACDDLSACTVGDTCTAGACIGRVLSPDDHNPCTDDACDPAIGVINVPNTLPCDDHDACSVGDVCHDAVCVRGPDPLDCDDQNACTDDACDAALGCSHTNHQRACDDHDQCTRGDTCGDGACIGAPVDCDDGNACTTDSCNPAVGCVNSLILSNSCRPNIIVDFPPRGATLTSTAAAPNVKVTGHVTSGAGPITSLRINNTNVTVQADGAFQYTVSPTYGGNILVLQATDSLGSQRKRVQSFLWSNGYRQPTTAKNGIVTEGLGVWLDKVAIDDGNRSSPPNDLASIVQVALRTFDIAALVPSPAARGVDAGIAEYDIYVQNLTYSAPTATLAPQSGGIHLNGRIDNGHANIRAQRVQCDTVFGVCALPSTITGNLTWTSLVINVDLVLSVSGNDIVVTVGASSVQINGAQVHIDGTFGFLADFILGFFIDDFVNNIETQFNNQLRPVIGGLVRDGLRELAFNIPFDVPNPAGGNIPIDIVTDFQAVGCTTAGCRFVFRAGAYADSKVTPYTNSGVPNRASCGGGTQTLVSPQQKSLELVLADDTLNQVLFAAWRGGLVEFPVPASWLAGANLGDFGITNLTMRVSGLLSPTASDCGRSSLGAHLGDVQITASMLLFNQPVSVVVWASLVLGVDLHIAATPGGGNEIALQIDGVERLETEIDVLDENLIALEDVIRGLIEEQVLGDLIGQLTNKDIGSIPLPNIDLSGAISGLPPGTAIRILPEVLYRQIGNTIAGGRLY